MHQRSHSKNKNNISIIKKIVLCCSVISISMAIGVTHINAQQNQTQWKHALSLLGKPKLPPDFKYFNYTNPNAPKGGTLKISAIGTFDSLNPFIVKGIPAAFSASIYESLFTQSQNESATQYPRIAKAVKIAPDASAVTYKINQNAKWHDGKPITPEDVIWSLEILKKINPLRSAYYKNVVKAEKTGQYDVTFTFDQKGNRELPFIVGELTILPKHYWNQTDEQGNKRNINETTLIPPLGSGPYKIKHAEPGRKIIIERAKNYWGKNIPVNQGQYNFQNIHVEYYRDETVAFEAFKNGQFDIWVETRAQRWGTGYDVPAVKQGKIIKTILKTKNPAQMQAFIFNLRRSKFADKHVREAFLYAFDFEWLNKNIFLDQYIRTKSYFDNSELAAQNEADETEKKILQNLINNPKFKEYINPDIIKKIYQPPENKNNRDLRNNLRKAKQLLEKAGWKNQNGKLINIKTKQHMNVEFLIRNPSFERVILAYSKNLERLGIKTKIRVADTAQYENRTTNFDFDIIVGGWGQSLSPGNELRNYWGSESAQQNGSRNYPGIQNPLIDHLIKEIIYAPNRKMLVATTRALDRIMMQNHYLIPQWRSKGIYFAYWDKFGIPKISPQYGYGYPSTWWIDQEKLQKLEK